MRINNKWMGWVFAIACLSLGGCKKIVNPVAGNPDSQLAFITVSEYLNAEITPTDGGVAYILLDTSVAAYTQDGINTSLPNFTDGFDLYPEGSTNSTEAVPWIQGMHVYAGQHTMTLTDTGGHYPLIRNEAFTTNDTYPTTVIFSDSMGVFGSWITTDTPVSVTGQIRVRLIDLSPDAGSIFFTSGSQAPPPGSPAVMNYGMETSFINFPSPSADTTLSFLFYNAGDSVDVVAAAFLAASPGHSYTIIVQGYENAESYQDHISGRPFNFSPDLRTMMLQDF